MSSAAQHSGSENDCEEKQRLLNLYQVTLENYNRAVQVLSARKGVMTRAEYTVLREYSNKARGQTEEARVAMENHAHQHGC